MTNPKGWDETATGSTDAEEAGGVGVSDPFSKWTLVEVSEDACPKDARFWDVENEAGEVVACDIASEANARLIAAAPELLEALKTARQYVATVHGQLAGAVGVNNAVAPDLAAVDRAIAKATGRAEP